MKKFQQTVRFIDMSSTESRVSTKKAGIPMRTETEMMNLILQMAESLKVDAVALSGSRTMIMLRKMNFKTMMLFILLIILKT